MGTIIKDDKQVEVKDGESIVEACEQMWVPFACKAGVCQSCLIEVLEGADNLSELTQPEKDQGLNVNKRLACQCKLKSGTVKIKTP